MNRPESLEMNLELAIKKLQTATYFKKKTQTREPLAVKTKAGYIRNIKKVHEAGLLEITALFDPDFFEKEVRMIPARTLTVGEDGMPRTVEPNANTIGNYTKPVAKVFEMLTDEEKIQVFNSYAEKVENQLHKKFLLAGADAAKIAHITWLSGAYDAIEKRRQSKMHEEAADTTPTAAQEAQKMDRDIILEKYSDALEKYKDDPEILPILLCCCFPLAKKFPDFGSRLDIFDARLLNCTDADRMTIDPETGDVYHKKVNKVKKENVRYKIVDATFLKYLKRAAEMRAAQGWDFLCRRPASGNLKRLRDEVPTEENSSNWNDSMRKRMKSFNEEVLERPITMSGIRMNVAVAANELNDGTPEMAKKICAHMGHSLGVHQTKSYSPNFAGRDNEAFMKEPLFENSL